MKVSVLLFANLRETVGVEREIVDVPVGVVTAGALREHLAARGGAWADALAQGRALRVAVDQRVATSDVPLHDGAEIAFFPPVTGG